MDTSGIPQPQTLVVGQPQVLNICFTQLQDIPQDEFESFLEAIRSGGVGADDYLVPSSASRLGAKGRVIDGVSS